MSEQIVNALAEMKQVYLEQVSHNNLEQKRLDEEVEQINGAKKKHRWWDDDGDGIGWEKGEVDGKFKRKNKIKESDESNEIENHMNNLMSDETERSNEAASNVLRILKSISSLKPPVKENAYYNWRDTVDESLLWEIIDDADQTQVKEKKVNNYSGKDPVVSINPEMKTESVLIDSEELDEDFIEESIDIAADYLFEEGLSIGEIEDLIEELGAEEFSEWVVQFGYETLLEWRRGPGGTKVRGSQLSKGGKHISTLKGGAKTAAIRGTAEHKQRKAEKEAPSSSSGMTAALKSQSEKVKTKSSDKPAKKGFFGVAIERDRAARQKAGELIRQTVQTAQKAGQAASKFGSSVREPFETTKAGRNLQAALIKGLRTGSRAARDFAAREVAKRKVSMKEDFGLWVEDLLQEGYDLSEYTWDELYEEYEELQEKAVSEQQQKLFGLALSVKRGETPRSEVSDEVLKIVDTMSEEEIRKYAGTSHEGIPKKKESEDLAEKVIQFVRENR
jgi:hypothetical protein